MNLIEQRIIRPEQTRYPFAVYQTLSVTSGAKEGDSGTETSTTMDSEGDFDIYKSTFTATSGLAMHRLLSLPDNWMSQSAPLGVMGTGIENEAAPLPRRIPRGSTFMLRAWDMASGGTNTIRALHIGEKVFSRQLYPPRLYTGYFRDIVGLNCTGYGDQDTGSLTGNGTRVGSIQNNHRYDFEVQRLILLGDAAFSLQISVAGIAFNIFSAAAHSDLIGRSTIAATSDTAGGSPFVLPCPFLIPYGGACQITVADLSGSTNKIFVGLDGVFLSPGGGLELSPEDPLLKDKRDPVVPTIPPTREALLRRYLDASGRVRPPAAATTYSSYYDR